MPQHQAFVDYTPPVVQIHPIRGDLSGTDRTMHLKWTALDAHLAHRPIEINYRTLPDGRWYTVARALANTGKYDWVLPKSLNGRIMVRVSARDQAGNRVDAASGAVDLQTMFQVKESIDKRKQVPTVVQLTPKDKERARKLLQQGVDHLSKGEADLAVSRLRDALRFRSFHDARACVPGGRPLRCTQF